MIITNIQLTPPQISGNAEGTGIPLSVAPGYKYEDGKRTEEITHIKVCVVFVDKAYEKMNVKVTDLKAVLTQEMIDAAGGKMKVKFKNLTGKIYRTNSGVYDVSASADGVEVIA